MAVINTIEDLTQALDEHPEWVDALRARLLPVEVSETPRRLDAFIAKVDAYLEANDRRIEILEAQTEAIREEIQILKERHDAFVKRTEEIAKRTEEIAKRTEEIAKRTEVLERHVRNLERRFERQEKDAGFIKGELFERRILTIADMVADDLGLTWTRTLTAADLLEMIRNGDTSGIARGRLRSFRLMDLGMEAADQDGAPCYIVAQVSYTVDDRDVNRAVDGARMLTRFTGLPARAVVIGVRSDERIQGRIEAGDVFYWKAAEEDEEEDLLPR